jgi:hypothetical protein
MPFTGLGSPEMFAALNNAEDVSPTIAFLSPFETPFLDWLGDSGVVATSTKHEFLEEELRPNYLTTGSAIASATANTGITLSDFGDLLTVGTILENTGANPEIMRVESVVGPLSVLVSRAADGGAVGSLASAAQLFVRGGYALEGNDHPSIDVTRPRRRKVVPVGLFHTPIAISGTQLAINALGGVGTGELSKQETNRVREFLRDLEKEVLHGTFVNSTQTLTTYRGIRGLRAEVTSINSSGITASSFAANAHLYLGDALEACFAAGASENEDWGIVAGRGVFRDMSNMNDTKVQDSNEKESFKRLIREYEGPFGKCSLILSRALQPRELYIVPRNRVKVFPLQGRTAQIKNIAATGDSEKRLLIGEYGVEIHHAYAMARLRTT